MPFSNRWMQWPAYLDGQYDVDVRFNMINLIQMGGSLLETMLLRVLIDPSNRKDVSKNTRIIFCCSTQLILIVIAVAHVGSFVYVIVYLNEDKLFQKDANKTIMLLWVEISLITVPLKILYYIYTTYALIKNRKLKKENLNNPDIKEAI